ncbi:T9SS type A sorting domain-containing protein, partial [Flavobacteriaceae bacterium]|nr:T9SS type A sorting domain-containing protein [Flavobacteriaceae bacterium]
LRVIGDINLAGGQNISSKIFTFTIEGDSDYSKLTGANDITRMFTINGGTGHNVTFKNLIITGATNSTGPGAVIGVFTNSTLTIDNCVFNGNSSINATGGGAILINNSSANLTINDTSFYQNSNTASGGQGGAIAILASASAALTNCTFFENTITRTDRNFGGAIRTNSTAPLTVTNCLFYNNKANNGAGGNSDVMGTSASGRTITNSILQYTNNTGSGSYTNNNSTITDSDFLATSNLAWDATLNKVTFTAPNALTNDTPIDFGSDTEDVGAWDSKINIFKATTNNVWNDATNWSNGALPTSTDNVAVLSGAEVTLNTDATIVDVKVKAPIKINSGKSLIVTGEVSGDDDKVYYKRNLTAIAGDAEGWHLVASPVSGETYNNAYADAESLATSTTNTSLRGLGFYTTGATPPWSYLIDDDTNSGTFNSGLGYAMKRASSGQVKFIGNLNTDDAGVTLTTGASQLSVGFNLLGNPYTSFINSQTFLSDNSNLSQQIWVWDQTGGGNYSVKIPIDDFQIAPGQGFFVKFNSGTSINFAESNQSVQGTDTFLNPDLRTEIKLSMTDGVKNRYTKLYFSNSATTGYDFGWEGEVFGGVENSINIYTHLVDDNQGRKYQIQSLPLSNLDSSIIPLGVQAEAGKTLTFSVKNTNLSSDVGVYLEDKQNNSFTLLDNELTFSTLLENGLDGVGRFYLHTSRETLSINNPNQDNHIGIYKISPEQLRIVGIQSGTASVVLYNTLGKQVLETSFQGQGANNIALPALASGVYVIQLTTESRIINRKIILN